MEIEKVKAIIQTHLPDADIMLGGDGYHFQATIITAAFSGKSLVQRQQLVYQSLNPFIRSGELHAISLKTYTPEEWRQLRN